MKFRAPSDFLTGESPAAFDAIRNCLVVDDDDLSRTVLVRQLGSLGVSVREAGEARLALSIWRDWRPDAVLIDCVMPGWDDGYGLAGRIRQVEREQGRRRATRLIGISGHTGRRHLALCEGAGMDGVLGKPASMQAFSTMLGLSPNFLPGKDYVDPRTCELHSLYVSSCESDLQMIEHGQRHCRPHAIGFHAHRIEGASRVVGAHAVAAAAAALQTAVAQGQPNAVLKMAGTQLRTAFLLWRSHQSALTAAGMALPEIALNPESAP